MLGFGKVRETRVSEGGRILRARASLNCAVLKGTQGDMSVVCPRRPPYEAKNRTYGTESSRPEGMTGLWQVSGRKPAPVQEMVRIERYTSKMGAVVRYEDHSAYAPASSRRRERNVREILADDTDSGSHGVYRNRGASCYAAGTRYRKANFLIAHPNKNWKCEAKRFTIFHAGQIETVPNIFTASGITSSSSRLAMMF